MTNLFNRNRNIDHTPPGETAAIETLPEPAVAAPVEAAPVVVAPVAPVSVPVDYAVLNVLVQNKFLTIQRTMGVVDGKLVETAAFSMISAATRGNPAQSLPIRFCPITGAELSKADLSQIKST